MSDVDVEEDALAGVELDEVAELTALHDGVDRCLQHLATCNPPYWNCAADAHALQSVRAATSPSVIRKTIVDVLHTWAQQPCGWRQRQQANEIRHELDIRLKACGGSALRWRKCKWYNKEPVACATRRGQLNQRGVEEASDILNGVSRMTSSQFIMVLLQNDGNGDCKDAVVSASPSLADFVEGTKLVAALYGHYQKTFFQRQLQALQNDDPLGFHELDQLEKQVAARLAFDVVIKRGVRQRDYPTTGWTAEAFRREHSWWPAGLEYRPVSHMSDADLESLFDACTMQSKVMVKLDAVMKLKTLESNSSFRIHRVFKTRMRSIALADARALEPDVHAGAPAPRPPPAQVQPGLAQTLAIAPAPAPPGAAPLPAAAAMQSGPGHINSSELHLHLAPACAGTDAQQSAPEMLERMADGQALSRNAYEHRLQPDALELEGGGSVAVPARFTDSDISQAFAACGLTRPPHPKKVGGIALSAEDYATALYELGGPQALVGAGREKAMRQRVLLEVFHVAPGSVKNSQDLVRRAMNNSLPVAVRARLAASTGNLAAGASTSQACRTADAPACIAAPSGCHGVLLATAHLLPPSAALPAAPSARAASPAPIIDSIGRLVRLSADVEVSTVSDSDEDAEAHRGAVEPPGTATLSPPTASPAVLAARELQYKLSCAPIADVFAASSEFEDAYKRCTSLSDDTEAVPIDTPLHGVTQFSWASLSRLRHPTEAGDKWANSEIVHAGILLLRVRDNSWALKYNRNGKRPLRCVYMLPEFAWTLYQRTGAYDFAGIRRWAKGCEEGTGKGLFGSCYKRFEDVDRILVPVCVDESHWVLIMINLADSEVVLFDSLGTSGQPSASCKQALLASARFVADVWQFWFGVFIDTLQWPVHVNPPGTPRQTNGYDCGLFTLMAARYVGEDLPFDYGQLEMSNTFRPMLALELFIGCMHHRGPKTEPFRLFGPGTQRRRRPIFGPQRGGIQTPPALPAPLLRSLPAVISDTLPSETRAFTDYAAVTPLRGHDLCTSTLEEVEIAIEQRRRALQQRGDAFRGFTQADYRVINAATWEQAVRLRTDAKTPEYMLLRSSHTQLNRDGALQRVELHHFYEQYMRLASEPYGAGLFARFSDDVRKPIDITRKVAKTTVELAAMLKVLDWKDLDFDWDDLMLYNQGATCAADPLEKASVIRNCKDILCRYKRVLIGIEVLTQAFHSAFPQPFRSLLSLMSHNQYLDGYDLDNLVPLDSLLPRALRTLEPAAAAPQPSLRSEPSGAPTIASSGASAGAGAALAASQQAWPAQVSHGLPVNSAPHLEQPLHLSLPAPGHRNVRTGAVPARGIEVSQLQALADMPAPASRPAKKRKVAAAGLQSASALPQVLPPSAFAGLRMMSSAQPATNMSASAQVPALLPIAARAPMHAPRDAVSAPSGAPVLFEATGSGLAPRGVCCLPPPVLEPAAPLRSEPSAVAQQARHAEISTPAALPERPIDGSPGVGFGPDTITQTQNHLVAAGNETPPASPRISESKWEHMCSSVLTCLRRAQAGDSELTAHVVEVCSAGRTSRGLAQENIIKWHVRNEISQRCLACDEAIVEEIVLLSKCIHVLVSRDGTLVEVGTPAQRTGEARADYLTRHQKERVLMINPNFHD